MFDFEVTELVPANIDLTLERAGKVTRGSFSVEFHYREADYVDKFVEDAKNGVEINTTQFLEQELASVSGLKINGKELSPEEQRAAIMRHLPLRSAVLDAWVPALRQAKSGNSVKLPKR